MTICPKAYLQNFQNIVDSNFSLKQNKPAKLCQRYWKFAKSGHTDVNQSFEHIFSIYFVVVFIVSSLIFQSLLLQLTFDVVFFELAQRYLSERRLLFGGGAAIAPLCRLRIPSCSPGFKSHAHYLCCFQFVLELILEWDSDKNEKRTKKRKRRRNCPIFFKKIVICELCSVVRTKSLNPPMSYFKQRNL